MTNIFECADTEELAKALEKGKARLGDLIIGDDGKGGYSAWEYGTGMLVAQYDTQEAMLDECGLVELYDGSMSNRLFCRQYEYDGSWHKKDEMEFYEGGWYLPEDLVEDYQGDIQLRINCERVDLQGYGCRWIHQDELHDYWFWCDGCDQYVYEDRFDSDEDRCYDCLEDEDYPGPILSYHGSSKNKWYGKKDKDGSFTGMGFELEIDGNPSSECSRGKFNQTFAESLAGRSGLDPDEVVFECDGSLDTGFEIISQPHTVAAFWERAEQWGRMLDNCAAAGYKSHDAGTCGLHVHVSRRMLGKSEAEQDISAGKIFKFHEERWDDLVKASRRDNFYYCGKNRLSLNTRRTFRDLRITDGVRRWGKCAKWCGTHGTALNNSRTQTFEFRLGRGTLNKASFFAWIDLCLVLAKNSRKSGRLLESHAEWLKGIKESTARYLYKRDAFREECVKLFPCLTWERRNESDGDSN